MISPTIQSPSFEEQLVDQFRAVIFSEGESRPQSTEGINDIYLKKIGDLTIHLSKGNVFGTCLLGDDTNPAILEGSRQLNSRIQSLYEPGSEREAFDDDLANGRHHGIPAKHLLSVTVHGPRSMSPTKIGRAGGRSYDFYELNPDNFAPVILGHFSVQAFNLHGTIDPDKKVIVSSPDGIVDDDEAFNPDRLALRLISTAIPVDIDKYDEKRAQIAEEHGIDIQPYPAAA